MAEINKSSISRIEEIDNETTSLSQNIIYRLSQIEHKLLHDSFNKINDYAFLGGQFSMMFKPLEEMIKQHKDSNVEISEEEYDKMKNLISSLKSKCNTDINDLNNKHFTTKYQI